MARAISEIADPRLVKALAHPLRVQILELLRNRTASPSELAEEIGVPLPNLSYHIRMLVQLDLLKLVKTRPRRGAIEHYYQSSGPVSVTEGAWGEVPELVKEAMVSGALRNIGKHVEAAAAAGGFDDGSSVLSRSAMKLDSKAFKELSKKLVELDRFASRLQKESEARNGEADLDVGVVLMLFKGAPADMPEAAAAPKKTPTTRRRAAAARSPRRKSSASSRPSSA